MDRRRPPRPWLTHPDSPCRVRESAENNAFICNLPTQGPLEATSGPTRSIHLSEFYREPAFLRRPDRRLRGGHQPHARLRSLGHFRGAESALGGALVTMAVRSGNRNAMYASFVQKHWRRLHPSTIQSGNLKIDFKVKPLMLGTHWAYIGARKPDISPDSQLRILERINNAHGIIGRDSNSLSYGRSDSTNR
jgi:hypothetical protein